MAGLRMRTDEGHLGGYIIGRPAPGTWCPKLWDWFVEQLGVHSVLDIGCGPGYVLDYMRARGCEILGVDGSPSAIEDTVVAGHVEQHDFAIGPWEPNRTFDLVWSSEFLEHVDEKYINNFLPAFASATSMIAVTYAIPGQGGHHHVNENTEDYWCEVFSSIGFAKSERLTEKARALIPESGREGKQFRSKGLVFVRDSVERS